VARAAPAVVGLGHRRGHGSGLVLSADGYVLTNSHVAREAGPLRVRLGQGAELPATLVGADDATDLAVVRVEGRVAAPLALAGERGVAVGELVVAIGNPLGFDRSVSLGVVSALYRSLPTGPATVLEGLIQTDAAVNPGNSGGPLLDAEGRVVGITTAMVPYARGIGFAVPASTASWVAAVLIQQGEVRRPYIGISARSEELGADRAAAARQARAVRVLGVEQGAPASLSGIQAQDLLLSANGRPLLTVDDLQRAMVLSSAPELHLGLDRAGQARSLVVVPAARPRAA
jgi:serine protease Do